jgi:glyoxylase-like metal-dependent hydrolase (beta-lactamase superfamily II)
MQIYRGLHVIEAPFENGRTINLYLFRGRRHLLVDSGVVNVPTETVIPYLREAGLAPTELTMLVNLHAHADHVGGNGELWAASGETLRIAAHNLDAPAIADHRRLARVVYGIPESDIERTETLLRRLGAEAPVHMRLQGGEVLDLEGIELQVIHAPGHTAGNIALYHRRERTLIHGETLMPVPAPDEEGLRATPFGDDPWSYRRTLRRLGTLDVRQLLSSHAQPVDKGGFTRWIQEATTALDEYDAVCRAALAQGISGIEEMAAAVAAEGRYRDDPLLRTQVARTLHDWVLAGRAEKTPVGGYRLSG